MFNKLSITFSAIVPEDKESIAAIQKALQDIKPEVINALLGAYLENSTGIPPYLIHFPKIDAGFVPSPEQEDEFMSEAVKWIESEVEDGNANVRDLARRCINYGLYSPVDAMDVICERMADEEEEDEAESGTPHLDAILRECESLGQQSLPVIPAPVNPTASTPAYMTEVLDEVEGFIAGFEGDATQEGVAEMLGRVRALHKQCSEEPMISMKTAFIAVFHGVIGAYHGSEGNPRYRALWPTAGRIHEGPFVEAREHAVRKSLELLGMESLTWTFNAKRGFLYTWLNEAGWSLPTNA